jgi:hypothetical protein
LQGPEHAADAPGFSCLETNESDETDETDETAETAFRWSTAP